MWKALFVAGLLVAGSANASANDYMVSGNSMLPFCKVELNNGRTYEAGACIGVVGAIFFFSRTIGFCPPQGATYGQASRVVVAYLERNPAKLHMPFIGLARDALIAAWPCR